MKQEVRTDKPAVWQDDPECGHTVACAFQTHYCSYVRVPRLLSLQTPQHPDELLLITTFQWYELWFKVLLTDLRAVLADRGTTYEPVKLLRRGLALFDLFDHQAAFAESVLVRELKLTETLRPSQGLYFSAQFAELDRLSHQLPRLARTAPPDLAQAMFEYVVRLRAFRSRLRKLAKSTLLPAPSDAPSYAEWLCLDELLDLQQGVKADWAELNRQPVAITPPEQINADENMFIVVHQCFELWFKVILEHIDRAIGLIAADAIPEATRLMRQAGQIERLLVQQIHIPATMGPLDFARFREERLERDGKVLSRGLSPASGTESYQFREIEIVCGLNDDPTFGKYLQGSAKLPIRLLTPRQRERLRQPSLGDAFRSALKARGVRRLESIFTPANIENPNADLARLADALLDFDEAFSLWRIHHLSMVEKMIGHKSGTGFLGPEYLMETAGIKIQGKNRIFKEKQVRPRFFKELWQVRSRLGAY